MTGALIRAGILCALPKQLHPHSSCFHIAPCPLMPRAASAFRQRARAGNSGRVVPPVISGEQGAFFCAALLEAVSLEFKNKLVGCPDICLLRVKSCHSSWRNTAWHGNAVNGEKGSCACGRKEGQRQSAHMAARRQGKNHRAPAELTPPGLTLPFGSLLRTKVKG